MAEQATARNIEGWVRNCRDGTVEAVVAGREEAVRDLIDWCWRGPALARVDDIQEAAVANTHSGEGFRQVSSC